MSDGALVLESPTPVMWDSSGVTDETPDYGEPVVVPPVAVRESAPVPGDEVAVMDLEVDDSSVVVAPDTAMLTDSSTEWPVYVDPIVITPWRNVWAKIQTDEPNKQWLRYPDDPGGTGVGVCEYAGCTSNYVRRLAFQFKLPAKLHDAHIRSARLLAFVMWSGTCTDRYTDLYHVNQGLESGTAVTWTNFHSWMEPSQHTPIASAHDHHGRDDATCATPDNWTSYDVLQEIQSHAEVGAEQIALGLRARSESLGSHNWKRFRNDFRLQISYNHTPATPPMPRPDADYSEQRDGTTYVTVLNPMFSTTVRDPDGQQGGTLVARFQVKNASGIVWTGDSAPTNPGDSAAVQVPALQDGGRYRIHVRTVDGDGRMSGWSEPRLFRVDVSPPDQPPQIKPVEGEEAVYLEGVFSGGPNKTGKFKITKNGVSSAVAFLYSWDQGASWTRRSADEPLIVTYTPDSPGEKQLWARTADRAGWVSPIRKYRFWVDFPTITGRWRFNDPVEWSEGAWRSEVAESESGKASDLLVAPDAEWVAGRYYSGGPGQPPYPGPPEYRDGALLFDQPGEYAHTDGAAVDTDEQFTVAAFVRVDDDAATAVAVSQDGTHTSAFNLGYVAGDPNCPTTLDPSPAGCYQFWMPDQDAAGASPASKRLRSPIPVVEGEWVLLVGMFRPDNGGQMQFATCDEDMSVWPETFQWQNRGAPGWASLGDLQVGRGQLQSAPTHGLLGAVDELRIYDNSLTRQTVTDICGMTTLGQSPG